MSVPALNFVTFNQDHTCLAVGTSKGFRIYHTDPFSKIFSSDDGSVSIIEMLFSTSLVAMVLSPRRLVIQNTKRASVICELTFPSAVLAVRLNRKRLAVVLEDEIYLYDIANMSLLYTIATSPNPGAICALAPSSENCYLAYPLPKPREDRDDRRPAHAPPLSSYVAPTSGEVLIFDAITLKAVNVIEAHRSPLSCIAISSDGTLLATASETGTIIRVFAVPKGKKLYQFRRGTYPSTIYSMSFNHDASLLCVSSTSDTVHIFRLGGGPAASVSASGLPADAALAGSSSTMYADGTASTSAAAGTSGSPRQDRWGRSRSRDSLSGSPGSAAGSLHKESPDPPGSSSGASSTVGGAYGHAPNGQQPLPPHQQRRQSGSFGSMLRRSSQIMGRSVAGVVGPYLPQTVTEIWEPQRDFAFIKIPRAGPAGGGTPSKSGAGAGGSGGSTGSGVGAAGRSGASPGGAAGSGPSASGGTSGGPLRSVVAMSSSSPQVMVVTSDGSFNLFNINMETGGEGFLADHFSILDGDDKLEAFSYGS